MPIIHFLTWNLHKRDAALDLLTRHLAKCANSAEPFVAAVQECADGPAAVERRIRDGGRLAVHAVGNGTMSVICSAPLDPIAIPNDPVGNRLVLTRTRIAGRALAIVNYHGRSRGMVGSPDPVERGGIASEARWRIDDHAGSGSVIVLGDFNAQPTDIEVTSVHCFSMAPHPRPTATRSHNRERQDLRVVPLEKPHDVAGTYHLDSQTEGSVWRTLDFVAVGRSSGCEASASVLTSLDGELLWDGTKISKSDHLPVGGTLSWP